MGLLEQQAAIVTGAGTGIGAATAIRFAREGAGVVLVGRRREKLEETAASIQDPDRTVIVSGDVREPEVSAAAVAAADERFGRLDVLVNNAAIALPMDVVKTDLDDWRKVFDVILVGAFRFSQQAARRMIEKKTAGRIVNVTSIHGTQAEREMSHYGSAKAAANQFARCLAVELAPHNIRVNAIAPGFVETPMSSADGSNELESEWFLRDYVARRRIPMERAGQPEEIAAAILFLASRESSYVNGHVLTVDGGLTCTF